jgi:hypothetical protein
MAEFKCQIKTAVATVTPKMFASCGMKSSISWTSAMSLRELMWKLLAKLFEISVLSVFGDVHYLY